MTRAVRLWTFCSVKGGVGKSSLAVACAKLLARSQRDAEGVVLIDCDMTGTSLADGLRLRAPNLKQDTGGAEGRLRLDIPPENDHLSWDDTRRQRSLRRDHRGAHPPPFLNDALRAIAQHRHDHGDGDERVRAAVNVESILWHHETDDGVRYLPSSPLRADVAGALEWLFAEPFDWLHSFTWLLDALIVQRQGLTDVVLDLPPGVWGFSHEVLVLTAALQQGGDLPEGFPSWKDLSWTASPFLVMTADRGDLLPALEYLAREYAEGRHFKRLTPLLNRQTEGLDMTRRAARELLGPTLGKLDIEKSLCSVDVLPSLQKLFLDQDLHMDQQVLDLGEVLNVPRVS